MTQLEFENLLDGLFDTMNNIYKAYCDANNISNRNLDIELNYNNKDKKETMMAQLDGTVIPNTSRFFEREV